MVTNGGRFHSQLEQELCEYLHIPHISLCSNGTIALMVALKALGISGDVITTPYSFVATSHALIWNGLTPVFVDIDPLTMNIDPRKIEKAITERTSAILAVHCYGTPCDVDAIQAVASANGLRVIYDAAHAFGVECHCGSVLNHGDLSVLSFHGTKVFNTFEGGAIICKDIETKQKIDQLKNFGFIDEVTVVAAGINGKMSEFNSALGLLQLRHVDHYIAERRLIFFEYLNRLSGVIGLSLPDNSFFSRSNFSYFPIRVMESFRMTRDQLYNHLQQHQIMARRYFYPLISTMDMYRDFSSSMSDNLVEAHNAASSILCLPIYEGLDLATCRQICDLVRGA